MEFKINAKAIIAGIILSSGLVFAEYTSVLSYSTYESTAEDPVGTVVIWGQNKIPDGWLELNGQSTAGYPDLVDVYGANLPDLRGNFIRGFGGNSSALNSFQVESMKSHGHTASFVGNALPPHTHTGTTMSGTEAHGNGDNEAANDNYHHQTISSVSAGTPTGTITVATSGESEVRPINVAMKFIVKAE